MLDTAAKADWRFPRVQWVCESECNGQSVPWMYLCSTCLAEEHVAANMTYLGENVSNGTNSKPFRQLDASVASEGNVVLMNRVGWHHFHALRSTKESLETQTNLLQTVLESGLFLSFPMSPVGKDGTLHGSDLTNELYKSQLLPTIHHPLWRPMLDLAQLEQACVWDNCTANLDEREPNTRAAAPFVNRWKAQMLLNTLCIDEGSDPRQDTAIPDGKVGVSLKSAILPKSTTSNGQNTPLPTDTKTSSSGSGDGNVHDDNRSFALAIPFVDSVRNENINGDMEFVPFPHRDIGIGTEEAACDWKYYNTELSRKNPHVAALLGRDFRSLDGIQSKALTETVCVPPNTFYRLHLFSAAQARKCLSNVTLALSGDSFTRNLFLELGSILFGRTTNVEIIGGGHRNNLLHLMNEVRKI